MDLYVGPPLPDGGWVVFRNGDDVAFIDVRDDIVIVEFEKGETFTIVEMEFVMEALNVFAEETGAARYFTTHKKAAP